MKKLRDKILGKILQRAIDHLIIDSLTVETRNVTTGKDESVTHMLFWNTTKVELLDHELIITRKIY